MDTSIQKGLVMTDGLAFFTADDRAIEWMGMIAFLRDRHYTPGTFRAAIVDGDPQAMDTARELVGFASERINRKMVLAAHTTGMLFQKLDLGAGRAHSRETVEAKEILLN